MVDTMEVMKVDSMAVKMVGGTVAQRVVKRVDNLVDKRAKKVG